MSTRGCTHYWNRYDRWKNKKKETLLYTISSPENMIRRCCMNIWHKCVCQRSKDIACIGRNIRDICDRIYYTRRSGLINYRLICYDRFCRIVSTIVSRRIIIDSWINARLILATWKMLHLLGPSPYKIILNSLKRCHLLCIDLMLRQLCLVIGKETTLVARLFIVYL